MFCLKLFCLKHCRPYIVVEITWARENPFRVKGNDFAKHRFRLRCSPRRSLRRTSVPLFLAETKSERASERLRTVSGPLSHSIAFTEEFQVVPSVQQAWNARMVVCIYASVEIQARRKSRRFPILTHCSLSTYTRHVFILTWRVYVRRVDDTELWEWESRCDPHDL